MPRLFFFPYATLTATITHSVKAVVPRQGNIRFSTFSLRVFIYLFIHLCTIHVSPLRNNLCQNVSRSTCQEIPFFLKNAKDNCRIHYLIYHQSTPI